MKDHIGELIKHALEQENRKPKWLADKIGCDRTNIYDIFERKDVNISLLIRISKALHRNLLMDLARDFEGELDSENSTTQA